MKRFLILLWIASFFLSGCVTTDAPQSSAVETEETSVTHVLNKRSKNFHNPQCSFVDLMKPSNKKPYGGERSTLIKFGYTPCGHCLP